MNQYFKVSQELFDQLVGGRRFLIGANGVQVGDRVAISPNDGLDVLAGVITHVQLATGGAADYLQAGAGVIQVEIVLGPVRMEDNQAEVP